MSDGVAMPVEPSDSVAMPAMPIEPSDSGMRRKRDDTSTSQGRKRDDTSTSQGQCREIKIPMTKRVDGDGIDHLNTTLLITISNKQVPK